MCFVTGSLGVSCGGVIHDYGVWSIVTGHVALGNHSDSLVYIPKVSWNNFWWALDSTRATLCNQLSFFLLASPVSELQLALELLRVFKQV